MPLWNVVPEECLPQQYQEDYGFLKSSSAPDKKKTTWTSKASECPTNFQKCTCDRRALACDIQYPCSLFRNQIWNSLEIYTVPLSAARSLLGLAFKSLSLACCFIECFFIQCFILAIVEFESLEQFWFKGWRVNTECKFSNHCTKNKHFSPWKIK